MKKLIILALLLSGCGMQSYEDRQRDEIKEGKTRLINQIINADREHSNYEVLAIYKYKYALAEVVSKVALKDGWELVGGMAIDNNGSESSYSSFMQTIKKTDKTISVYRLENGNLALSKTVETK